MGRDIHEWNLSEIRMCDQIFYLIILIIYKFYCQLVTLIVTYNIKCSFFVYG